MIEISKEYTTHGNHEVRIYANDAGGNYPIHGAIKINNEWAMTAWTKEGYCSMCNEKSMFDLVEKPKEHTIKVAFWVYGDNILRATLVSSLSLDDWRKDKTVLAIKEITFKEGEGL